MSVDFVADKSACANSALCISKAVMVTITVRLRFDFDSIMIQLQFDYSYSTYVTTVRLPVVGCCTAV